MSTGAGLTIGIDIGGTKIAAGRVAVGVGDAVLVSEVVRVATPVGSAAILQRCADLVDRLRADHDVRAVGVGAPGVIDPVTGTVLDASAVVPGWTGTEVAGELAARVGLPVRVENDVRAFARAESQFGAGRGSERCLYAAFGTGVGGALVVDGALRDSPRSTVGEIAHLSVQRSWATACGCGRSGHLESIACGPAMAAEFARRSGSRHPRTLHEVGAAAARGDATALAVVGEAAQLAGEALAGVACALDLDAIVVGGGAVGVHPEFLETLARTVAAAVWPPGRTVAVRPGRFGGSAAVIGAGVRAAEHRNAVLS